MRSIMDLVWRASCLSTICVIWTCLPDSSCRRTAQLPATLFTSTSTAYRPKSPVYVTQATSDSEPRLLEGISHCSDLKLRHIDSFIGLGMSETCAVYCPQPCLPACLPPIDLFTSRMPQPLIPTAHYAPSHSVVDHRGVHIQSDHVMGAAIWFPAHRYEWHHLNDDVTSSPHIDIQLAFYFKRDSMVHSANYMLLNYY